jgi:cell division septation protein DedD
MRNNETGEFELLVGNRQLLSGFFIVVLLFAVAFSMGYIVGRNSSPSAKLQAETGSSAGTASQTPETRPQPASQAPAAAGAPDATPSQPADAAQGAPPADTPPQPSTQPERGPGSPSGAAAPPPAAAAPPPPAAPGPGGTPEAVPGSYWQVLATASQTSADAMRQTMKDKGFPASLQPGPNNLIRVLIGPYTDKQSLGRAKTELENAGVHPVLK